MRLKTFWVDFPDPCNFKCCLNLIFLLIALSIADLIDFKFVDIEVILGDNSLPFCLSPIFITLLEKYGASIRAPTIDTS